MPERGNEPDPVRKAQLLSAPPVARRFYGRANIDEHAGSFALRLDNKPARTPGGRPLAVVSRTIAEAIVGEWNAQVESIDPGSMPVTRLANSAIDGVALRLEETRESILAYAGSDLVCYRAGDPDGLVNRQREHWDPIVAWVEEHFGVTIVLAEGVVHVAQPDTTIAAIAAQLARMDDPLALAGLSVVTTLTGSAFIALALAHGVIATDQAWAAAHVDEDWNISQWGEDREAANRRAARYRDFKAATLALGRD